MGLIHLMERIEREFSGGALVITSSSPHTVNETSRADMGMGMGMSITVPPLVAATTVIGSITGSITGATAASTASAASAASTATAASAASTSTSAAGRRRESHRTAFRLVLMAAYFQLVSSQYTLVISQ